MTYGTAARVFPFKPRDTVTRIAFRELPAGGAVLLLRAVEHPAMPPRRGYVRARVLRGMTVMQPVPGRPGMTNFTFTQQIDVGGIAPPWIVNQLITRDAVSFVKRVGIAAARRDRAGMGGWRRGHYAAESKRMLAD